MKLIYYPNNSTQIADPIEILSNGKPYEIIRGSLSGFGGISVQHFTNQTPNQTGATYYYSKYDERTLSFKFRIFADSFNDMQTKKRNISRMFSSAFGEGKLRIYTDIHDSVYYDISVIPDGMNDMFTVNSEMPDTYCECKINLTAYNPFFMSPNDNSVDISAFTGGLSLPLTFPFNLGRGGGGSIINNGDVDVPCTITIFGPFTNPKITNDATGEFIEVDKSGNDGDKLIINTNPQTSSVIFETSLGVRTNVFNLVTVDSTLFMLGLGLNTLSYTDTGGISSNGITVSWRDNFIGVF